MARIGIWIARGGLHTEYDYVIVSFPRLAYDLEPLPRFAEEVVPLANG